MVLSRPFAVTERSTVLIFFQSGGARNSPIGSLCLVYRQLRQEGPITDGCTIDMKLETYLVGIKHEHAALRRVFDPHLWLDACLVEPSFGVIEF